MPRRKRITDTGGPLCKVCGATNNTPFAMFPKTAGYGFGEICAGCDDRGGQPEAGQEAERFELVNDAPRAKPAEWGDGQQQRQRPLIEGLDCCPGQQDLF